MWLQPHDKVKTKKKPPFCDPIPQQENYNIHNSQILF
jgi:hypothetical protein